MWRVFKHSYQPLVSVIGNSLTIALTVGWCGLKEIYLQLIYVCRTDVQGGLHIAIVFVVAGLHIFNKLLHMSLHVNVNPAPFHAPSLQRRQTPTQLIATSPEEIIPDVRAEQLQRQLRIKLTEYIVTVLSPSQLAVERQLWQQDEYLQ